MAKKKATFPPFVEIAQKWLAEHGCVCLRVDDDRREDRIYEYHAAPNGQLLILAYAHHWCDVFVPVVNSNDVQDTLAALEKRITGPAGARETMPPSSGNTMDDTGIGNQGGGTGIHG